MIDLPSLRTRDCSFSSWLSFEFTLSPLISRSSIGGDDGNKLEEDNGNDKDSLRLTVRITLESREPLWMHNKIKLWNSMVNQLWNKEENE